MPEATHHTNVHVDERGASSRPATPRPATSAAGQRAGETLTFAVVVVAPNVIRGVFAPANDVSAATAYSSDFSGDGAIPYVLAATYVVSGVGLAVFLGGVTRGLLTTSRRGWAVAGVVGAIGVVVVSALVMAAEQALTVVAHMDRPELGAIQAVWALHNSTFAVLDLWIAIALVGLSRAAIAAGLTPRAFTWLAPSVRPCSSSGSWAVLPSQRVKSGAVRCRRDGLPHLARLPDRDRSTAGPTGRARRTAD